MATTKAKNSDEKSVNNNALGARLTEMRLAKGFSQRKLAQLSGLTNTAISSIEYGRSSPSINTLDQILRVLDSDLASFFASYQDESHREIHPIVKKEQLINVGIGSAELNLVHNGNPLRQLSMLIEHYPPHSRTDEKITHEGEEVGTVIEGNITIVLGETTYYLEAGDSYVFDTSIPHTFINESDSDKIGKISENK